VDGWTISFIAMGLAMDAFAVAVASGVVLPRITPRHVFRLSWHFGLFQFLMPILGWGAGRTVAGLIEDIDHWVAFALLVLVGGRMICSASNPDGGSFHGDPTRGTMLVMLSIATSIDALAVGLSLAMLRMSIWQPAAVIGVVAATLTALGLAIGQRVGTLLGKRMELVGGLVLIGIGLRVVITHLMS